MTEQERDALRKEAYEVRQCTAYLLLPKRSLEQARKDRQNETEQDE